MHGKLLMAAAAALLGAGPAAAQADVDFYPGAAEALDLPFSEAVRVGDLVFLAGQVGTSPDTGALVEGGIGPETRQMIENIGRILRANDLDFGDVVKCTVMLDDIGEWAAFNAVYREYFTRPYPARSAFGADGLALGARVEMECIAAR